MSIISNNYDTVVIGGGPAGTTAALHLSFHERKVIVVDRKSSPMAFFTNPINNFPGMKPISSGVDILRKMRTEAESFGTVFFDGNVLDVRGKCPRFQVKIKSLSEGGKEVEVTAKTVVFATGTARKHPRVKGDWHRWLPYAGKDQISFYCPDCESPLTNGKDVLVVNAGSVGSALHVARVIKPHAKRVRIFMTKDAFIPFTDEVAEVLDRSGFEWASGLIERVKVEKPGEKQFLITKAGERFECNHFFVGFVAVPRSEIAVKMGITVDKRGNIVTDHRGKTNIQGVWAAGDVRPITQSVAMAVGTGNYAGVMINQFLFRPDVPEETRDHPQLRTVRK